MVTVASSAGHIRSWQGALLVPLSALVLVKTSLSAFLAFCVGFLAFSSKRAHSAHSALVLLALLKVPKR